jgi:hypothetical protein
VGGKNRLFHWASPYTHTPLHYKREGRRRCINKVANRMLLKPYDTRTGKRKNVASNG